MEEKIFKTLIRKDHKLGEKEYVEGRISGIMFCMCADFRKTKGYVSKETDNGIVLSVMTTPKKYKEFCGVIKELYPYLCEFNYKW